MHIPHTTKTPQNMVSCDEIYLISMHLFIGLGVFPGTVWGSEYICELQRRNYPPGDSHSRKGAASQHCLVSFSSCCCDWHLAKQTLGREGFILAHRGGGGYPGLPITVEEAAGHIVESRAKYEQWESNEWSLFLLFLFTFLSVWRQGPTSLATS